MLSFNNKEMGICVWCGVVCLFYADW